MLSPMAPWLSLRRCLLISRGCSLVTSSSSPSTSSLPLPRRRPRHPTTPSLLTPTNHGTARPISVTTRRFASSTRLPIVDLRSDTVTQPTAAMLQTATTAPTGDDVMSEDPTIFALESYAADLFQKERALYVPTSTMANLCAILSHCHYNRSAEIILGTKSHIGLYEGGGYGNVAGASVKYVQEKGDATFDLKELRDAFRNDDDDHYAKTTLLCLENTHNMLGGVALPPSYIESVADLIHEETTDWNRCSNGGTDSPVKMHIDGARIFNAATSLSVPPAALTQSADSVAFCLSKGLGAPLGALLVGESEFIRIARRARKRLGGGMRQSGVVAAMGMHALLHNVERLGEDHRRAEEMARELRGAGFEVVGRDNDQLDDGEGGRKGIVDTNIVFFALPHYSNVTKEELPPLLNERYNVKIAGGYSTGGRMFRLVTHLDVDDEGVERALDGIISLCLG